MTPAQGVDPNLIAYLTFTAILVVTPGSTTAVVVRNTLEGGRRAGLATAVGAALANSIHAAFAGLGLSALLAYWPGLVQVARLGGAGYLAWLGLMSLRRAWLSADGGIRFESARVTTGATEVAPYESSVGRDFSPADHHEVTMASSAGTFGHAERQGFRDGVAINMLNPTIISFYVAIVPSFIPASAARSYFVMLAASHVSMALVCHSAWAAALDAVRRWFAPPAARRALEAATGVALVALAVRVLM